MAELSRSVCRVCPSCPLRELSRPETLFDNVLRKALEPRPGCAVQCWVRQMYVCLTYFCRVVQPEAESWMACRSLQTYLF